MNITIIGTGYVGLVTGICFAEIGHSVTCIDVNAEKIALLKQGKSPIYEEGLDELLARNLGAGRLTFSTDLAAHTENADAIFVAVGTPTCAKTGHTDLRFIDQVAIQLAAQVADRPVLIVVKSTIPVGTISHIDALMRKHNKQGRWQLVFNPEFLREGVAIKDALNPERIVLGMKEDAPSFVRDNMHAIYAHYETKGVPIVETSIASAEIIKYAANSFLATKIAFVNELSLLCEQVGGDIADVAKAIGMDSRIGKQFLQAGPGYGGSCFPKDTLEFANSARESGAAQEILEAVIASNDRRKMLMAERIIGTHAASGGVRGKRIAILGVAFKANTDDIRESPALPIIAALEKAGANLSIYDPEAMAHAKAHFTSAHISWCQSIEEAVSGADSAVIITEWPAFAAMDLKWLATQLSLSLLVDLRNLFTLAQATDAGLSYVSIGRPHIFQSASGQERRKLHG